jgi:hypothetical protein
MRGLGGIQGDEQGGNPNGSSSAARLVMTGFPTGMQEQAIHTLLNDLMKSYGFFSRHANVLQSVLIHSSGDKQQAFLQVPGKCFYFLFLFISPCLALVSKCRIGKQCPHI